MDAIVTGLLTQLPNFAIAVWCISNYQQTIRGLLDQQNKLLDQLLQARGLKTDPVLVAVLDRQQPPAPAAAGQPS